MTKRIISCALLFVAGFLLFAGDVARFVDMGFSRDGKTYFFGQYGKTDKTFLPYAEIYAVDVKKNDFVKTFKTTGATQSQSGFSVFEELTAKNSNFFASYNFSAVPERQILYLREDDSHSAASLEFTDFEHSTRDNPVIFSIRLVPYTEGKGKDIQSSFYIVVERKTQLGTLIDRTIAGNPDIKRKGVSGYRIEKIFTDSTGQNLVFVVEKTLAENDGISVRYMVETAIFK
jgi:predicted secreted protein